MKRMLTAALLTGMVLCTGCAKQQAPAPLQTGYLDISDLNGGEPYSQDLTGGYEMADENAAPPAEDYTRYVSADGEMFLFDRAGRLRSYSSQTETPSGTEPSLSEEELSGICDEVLSSYIADYADFTEITTQYYNNDTATYNLAKEHSIAEGISDYALIRLDAEGQVHDLNISYADADGDSAEPSFVTDDDKAYFEEQAQPYLTALDGYSAEVTYTHYKYVGGKLYAFYEITYTDLTTGYEAGTKQVIFVRK